eukprot:TRINITY_DN7309_c0_g1_i1.p1 TRINITY_DN7309_c0_g1~~TRINITY_DN7309_c0_g1_i1.p1  ORF type:complete len:553 (-),score=65.24 TRINITY_DN7309_c0_g1_i1:98-1756(-)
MYLDSLPKRLIRLSLITWSIFCSLRVFAARSREGFEDLEHDSITRAAVENSIASDERGTVFVNSSSSSIEREGMLRINNIICKDVASSSGDHEISAFVSVEVGATRQVTPTRSEDSGLNWAWSAELPAFKEDDVLVVKLYNADQRGNWDLIGTANIHFRSHEPHAPPVRTVSAELSLDGEKRGTISADLFWMPGLEASQQQTSWCDCGRGLQYVSIFPKGSPRQAVKLRADAGFQVFEFETYSRRFSYSCSGSKNSWYKSNIVNAVETKRWRVRVTVGQYALCPGGAGRIEYRALDAKPAGAATYSRFKKEDIESNMVYADCDGNTADGDTVPKEFGGLWWMDGNPASIFEVVASFGQASWHGCETSTLIEWSDEERAANVITSPFGDKVPCRGVLVFKFSANRGWAMPDTFAAKTYAWLGTMVNQNMEFVCGGHDPGNLTVCKLGASQGLVSSIMNKLRKWLIADTFNTLTKFAMVKADDNLWVRYSLMGRHRYFLKRVISCDGKWTHYKNEFMSHGTAVPERNRRDVFGHGRDKRNYVNSVPDDLFVIEK